MDAFYQTTNGHISVFTIFRCVCCFEKTAAVCVKIEEEEEEEEEERKKEKKRKKKKKKKREKKERNI